jgi:hypothetical protein
MNKFRLVKIAAKVGIYFTPQKKMQQFGKCSSLFFKNVIRRLIIGALQSTITLRQGRWHMAQKTKRTLF